MNPHSTGTNIITISIIVCTNCTLPLPKFGSKYQLVYTNIRMLTLESQKRDTFTSVADQIDLERFEKLDVVIIAIIMTEFNLDFC